MMTQNNFTPLSPKSSSFIKIYPTMEFLLRHVSLAPDPHGVRRTCTHIQQSIHDEMQVAFRLEIFNIKQNQTFRQPCVVDARDKTQIIS